MMVVVIFCCIIAIVKMIVMYIVSVLMPMADISMAMFNNFRVVSGPHQRRNY